MPFLFFTRHVPEVFLIFLLIMQLTFTVFLSQIVWPAVQIAELPIDVVKNAADMLHIRFVMGRLRLIQQVHQRTDAAVGEGYRSAVIIHNRA